MDQSEQLIPLFESCTARISVESVRGTGFFVAPQFLLTCAHVVENVQNATSSVMVQWKGKSYTANIVHLSPTSYPDLALLKVENIPSNHPCVFLHKAVSIDDPLYSYGYSKIYPQGEPSSFQFEGMTGDTSPLMKFKFGESRQGFSGSPLLNRRTGGVCGVMKLTRGENSLLGGRGVPVSTVLDQLSELIDLQKEFHQNDSRWFDSLSLQQRQFLGLEATQQTTSTIEVYYSFAKKDGKLARELQKHLILLKRENYITEWYPGEVVLGEEPSELNKQHLNTACIILLLVSPDFILEKGTGAQDNFEVEMAMERRKAGAIVIPIKLRSINNWDLTPFGKLVFLPRNGKPVAEWKYIDAAFAEIAGEIRGIVDNLRKNESSFSKH